MTLNKPIIIPSIIIICFWGICSLAAPDFPTHYDFPYWGSEARDAVFQDLNGDSLPDFAIPSTNGNSVSIIISYLDGSFLFQSNILVGNYPIDIEPADLDGDGDLDLVTANRNSNDVSVLLNNGLGAFEVLPPIPVHSYPTRVVIADFDDNDTLDLAVSHQNHSALMIFLGNGDGTFAPTNEYQVGNYQAGLSANYFDGDEYLDLAVMVSVTQSVIILSGQGDGSFNLANQFQTNLLSMDLQVEDIDQDSNLDLIITSPPDGVILVYHNLGNAQFSPPQTLELDSNPRSALIADIDSDQDLDIVSCLQNENFFVTFLNDGSGTFSTQVPSTLPYPPDLALICDIDNDQINDVITISETCDQVMVSTAVTPGAFQFTESYPVGGEVGNVFAYDINQDHDLDVLTLNWGPGTISVLENQGDGSFLEPDLIPIPEDMVDLLATDVSGDGYPDLIALGGDNHNIIRLVNMGSGLFTDPVVFEMPGSANVGCVGDLDGDFTTDLVLGGDQLIIAYNDGGGGFLNTIDFPQYANCTALQLTDLNDDQHLDLILSIQERFLYYMYSDSVGGFHEPILIWEFPNYTHHVIIRNIEIEDFNGDHNPDLAITADNNFNFGQAAIFFQNSAGFGEPTILNYPELPQELTVGDIDSDNNIDIVVTTWESSLSPIQIYENLGGGIFQATQNFYKQGKLFDLTLSDLDQDDDLDLIAANYTGNSLMFWENDGSGNFADAVIYGIWKNPLALVCHDLDRDSIPDIASVHEELPGLSMLWNEPSSHIKSNPHNHDFQPLSMSPLSFRLLPPFPNPFNSQITIPYTMETPGYVALSIYNILGQKVFQMVKNHSAAGAYRITWTGTDQHGIDVASGIYFITLQPVSAGQTFTLLSSLQSQTIIFLK